MKCAAPEDEWRTTKISAAIASRFQSVSRKVSPFDVLERAISMFNTLADKRFAAASKVVRVRVEFSKKRFITVRPSKSGRLIKLLLSSKKL